MSAPAGCWRELGRARRRAALRGDRGPGRGRESAAGNLVTIAAPQPLSLGAEMPVELLAGCVGIAASDVIVTSAPAGLRLGRQFLRHRRGHGRGADPRRARYRPLPRGARDLHGDGPGRLPLYLYAHDGERASARPHVLAAVGHDRGCRRPAAPPRRSPRCCCRSPRTASGATTSRRASRWAGRACCLLGPARRRRHPRQRRRRLRAGAEGRGLALGGLDDEARAREVDDDVADPLVAAR